MVFPPVVKGRIKKIGPSDRQTSRLKLAVIETTSGVAVSMNMIKRWPVRKDGREEEDAADDSPCHRPACLDMLFPMAKGGTACVPGPFEAARRLSSTVGKWADAEIVVLLDAGDARQRDDRCADGIPEPQGPAWANPYGTDGSSGQHFQYARCGTVKPACSPESTIAELFPRQWDTVWP